MSSIYSKTCMDLMPGNGDCASHQLYRPGSCKKCVCCHANVGLSAAMPGQLTTVSRPLNRRMRSLSGSGASTGEPRALQVLAEQIWLPLCSRPDLDSLTSAKSSSFTGPGSYWHPCAAAGLCWLCSPWLSLSWMHLLGGEPACHIVVTPVALLLAMRSWPCCGCSRCHSLLPLRWLQQLKCCTIDCRPCTGHNSDAGLEVVAALMQAANVLLCQGV